MSRHILAIEEEKDPQSQFGVFKIGSRSKVSRHVTDRQIELYLENSSSMKDFKEIELRSLISLSEKSFIDLLSHPKFSNLEALTIHDCDCVSDKVISVIATSNLKRLALKSLKFVNSEGYIKLFTESSSLLNLEYLQLKSAYTFDDAALAVLSQCQLPKLTRLDLRKCDKLTSKGFKALSESLFLPRITHLNISMCYKLNGGELREFLNPTSLRSLRHLKIKGLTGLRDEDLEWIINSEVGKQLKTLSFKYCRFSDSTYQVLLNAKLNSLTKLTIPITSWYLEEILNSPAMSQVTCLEIYDIRSLVDHQNFRGKQDEFSKFDIIPKRIDEILSNSKQLVNLTKLKVPAACPLPKFWKSDNCLKIKSFSFVGKDVNKAQKKKSVKRYVTMPSIETQNQILHDFRSILIPSGSDYILGKDLSHVESLFIENIQDVYHLGTAKFQKLKTLTVSLKDDHGIARFAEIDMRPAKLAKLKIKGNYNWSLFAEVIPMSKNFLYLQSIKMGVVGVSNNYLEAFKNLRALRYLKKITFSAGSITISALSTIIANVPGLEEISLRECTLEQEAAPKVGDLIDFKGVIKTHREHFFENIYLEPCSFRLITKKKASGRYYDGRTSTLSKATKEKPYEDFSIILAEAPNWSNEDDGGYYGVQRTINKFSEYYEKDSRGLHWIKTWDTKGIHVDSMVNKPILDKCTGVKTLRSYTGGLSIFAAYASSLESLQTITTRYIPEEADIQLFGPYMCTVMVLSDKANPFDVLKRFCETLLTHEKCKLVNTFLVWEYGNKGGQELSPFDEVVNLVTSTRLKDFRYIELPTYKFDFTPENKEALKVILLKLTTLKNNQTLLLSLLTKLVQLFDKHLEAFKEDDEKDEQVLEYFAKIFRDSNDIAEIICFYAVNYNRPWLRRSILKITAPMPMTQEEIKRLYLREIWDTTFTDIYFLKDETEIHNPLAFEYAFKEFQAKPDDKIVLRIVDRVLANLSPEQLKAMPKTKEPGYIFRHPLFYDTEYPWTFAEYSLTLKDLDVYLNKHSKDMADNNKKMILWEKADHRHIDSYFNVLDCTRIKELVFDFLKLSVRSELYTAVESLNLKTVTFKADSTNITVYSFGSRWLPAKVYEEIERINIEIVNMTHLNAEPWQWLVQVLENIKPNCTLNITAENNGKCVVPLEAKELPVLKVKKLILQGKTAFNFFSELHSKMKIQTLECLQVKIKRKPNDNWDEEKTDENEKKVLAYISKLKGNLNNIRIDIPLKLNSLIDILETPQWLQIKNFRIMSSGTNEELELIARAKNLSRLKTLHIDFSQRISHGESLTLYSQGIKTLLSGAKDILKELDWGRFFSEHSKYGLISPEIVKVAIKKNIFKEPSFKQWTLYTPHHKFPILAEDVIKVLENTDVNNFDIAQFIARNKEHPAITPKVYCYYVSGQFRNKILSLAAGPTPIIFHDKKSQTHTTLLDLLYTDKLTQAQLDNMIENQPLSIDDDFISIMCAFVDVINKHQIVVRTLHDKHKNMTSIGLNQLLKTFQYPQYPSLYKWVIDSTHYLQMTDLENLELLSTRDIRFFDIRKLHLSSHKFLYPCSNEESAILLDPSKMIENQSGLSDDAKHKRDAVILGLITQCYSLQWLHLDKLNLDDVFCMKLAVLHNEKLKNKNKLQLISIKENPYITFVGLKFLYSIPIADENFQQSHYGIIANCEVILDIPAVVALNDGIHAAVKSKFREYKRKKKARGLRYFDHGCIPLMLYSIICFPFAFFQYFDEEITQIKYLSKVRRAIGKVGDKFRGLLNIQAKKAEYVFFADMDDDQDKESGNRLRYIFSQGCIKLNAFFRNRKIWILLYVLHAVLYYFFAIFFPFWFVTECNSDEENYAYIAYGIYAGIATISEAWLLRKCVEIINNDQIAQFRLMVVVPLAISQNNKLSLFTDVLYLTTAYSCGNSEKAVISTISLIIFLVMNIIQIFNLLVEYIGIRKNSKTHNSTYIDLVAKFCYSTDLTTISALLEKISICCADQVGRVYVPQILQSIGLKSLTRTFPQAILQLISYLTSGFSSSSIVYLVSFVVSIVNLILAFYSLITAQPSACTPATVKRVFYKDFKSRLQQVKDSPKKKPKKISPTVIEAGTITKNEEKASFSKCIKNLTRKIDAFTASKNQTRVPAKTIGTDIQTLLRAHKKATVNRYEEAVAKLKAKYNRKGKVSGYYIQGGECPIEGTYTMVDGVIDMRTDDSAGSAKWDGVISIFSGVAKIAKRYEGRHFVGYNGDINWDNTEDVEVNGMWSMGGSGGGAGFKLVFKREEDEIEQKMSPADPVEETQLIDNPSKDFDRK